MRDSKPCVRVGCPGTIGFRDVADIRSVPEGGLIALVSCDTCDYEVGIARPTAADLERGRQLAEEHGW